MDVPDPTDPPVTPDPSGTPGEPRVIGDVGVLEDPSFTVPRVPPARHGVAWLRAHVVRFSEGDDHVRRRRLTEALLDRVDVESLRQPAPPTATLAEALGLPPAVIDDVGLVASCYQPHLDVTPEADAAVERLVAACGGTRDEETAARICLLVQAHDATLALIAGRVPPIATTRRIGPSGDEILVDLADAPFGAGRHACPGRTHALALAAGAFHHT